jgi:hypothetical protein
MPDYRTLVFTTEFTQSLTRLSSSDLRRIFRALEQLDGDECTPSLHIHQLGGADANLWTAYASRSLRMTFERLDGGRKRLIEASHHYGD